MRSLFLIISHAPGRLLPTTRSRCPPPWSGALLSAETIAAAIRDNGSVNADEDDILLA